MVEHGVPDSRLTVIKQVDDYIDGNNKHCSRWLCECSCEGRNQIVVIGRNLKNGNTQSCGCLHKENVWQSLHKKNEYNLSGEFGILLASNTKEEVYFDLEDAEKILIHNWYIEACGYPATTIDDKQIRLHSFLGYYRPDHHDRNKLNNRKSNLIECTNQENIRNSSARKNNTSGITGVYLNKLRNKWVAQNTIDRKTKSLGYYTNQYDAIRARLEAESKYFKEFAPQRHLFAEYDIVECE